MDPLNAIAPDLVGFPQLPSGSSLTAGAAVVAIGALLVPAAAGVAAARYGRFSPVKAAGVSILVSLAGAAVLSAVGVGAVAATS